MNPDTEMRTHVILSKALVARIDRLVGQRRRSRFIGEAIRRELAHLERLAAAEEAMGSDAGEPRPWGDTPEAIARWVHDDRQASLAPDGALDAAGPRRGAATG